MMKKLALLVLLAVLALPAAAATLPKSLPKVCAQLKKEGWTHPAGTQELNVPGAMYMCMLERVLPRAGGNGHAPDLQALISFDGTENSIILSADIWCEADQPSTLDALAKQFSSLLGAPLPDNVAAAVRAAKEVKLTADGLSYEVARVEVDANACRNVPANKLGPVLVKVDVVVKQAR